jgi:hypothetical protein
MHANRKLLQYVLLIPTVILILICPLIFSKTAASSAHDYSSYEAPVYEISLSEDIQHEIWNQCEQSKLSYELVLAVYLAEGDNCTQIKDIAAKIEKLANYRDFWAAQGFADEEVFALMLLSEQRGIEGCITFIKNNDSYEQDQFVQKVAEYKFSLEQSGNIGLDR